MREILEKNWIDGIKQSDQPLAFMVVLLIRINQLNLRKIDSTFIRVMILLIDFNTQLAIQTRESDITEH